MDLTKLTAFVPMIDSNAIFANEVLIVSSHTIACQQRMSVIEKMIAQDIMKKGKQYQPEVESRTQRLRPRPRTQKNLRPRTDISRTDPLEAKDRNARGQRPGTEDTIF